MVRKPPAGEIAQKRKLTRMLDAPPTEPRPLLYVKAGGPPDNWRQVRVIRKANGQEVRDVVEANAHEGWFRQVQRDKAGNIERDKIGRRIICLVRAAIRLEVRP